MAAPESTKFQINYKLADGTLVNLSGHVIIGPAGQSAQRQRRFGKSSRHPVTTVPQRNDVVNVRRVVDGCFAGLIRGADWNARLQRQPPAVHSQILS